MYSVTSSPSNNIKLNPIISNNVFFSGEQSGFTVCIPSQDSSSDIIKFNSVISNIGNHFNANTGQFRCQYPGMYFFSLSLYKNSRADSAQCWIRKNGANVIYAYSDPNMNADRGTMRQARQQLCTLTLVI